MEDKFKGHRSVKCLMLQDSVMDFTAFNEQVLAWPEAAAPAGPPPVPPAPLAPLAPVAHAAHADIKDQI